MEQNYFGAIEAVLFACGEPLELERLAAALAIEPAAARQQLDAYSKALADDPSRGLRLLMLDGAAQLCVKEAYEPQVMAAAAVKKNAPLSAAALETLAVIAYNQPVTKAFIEQVRGVECGAVVNNLVEKGLAEEAGRLQAPGRPILYKTTAAFLRCFGLESLDALPPVPQTSQTSPMPEMPQTSQMPQAENPAAEDAPQNG